MNSANRFLCSLAFPAQTLTTQIMSAYVLMGGDAKKSHLIADEAVAFHGDGPLESLTDLCQIIEETLEGAA